MNKYDAHKTLNLFLFFQASISFAHINILSPQQTYLSIILTFWESKYCLPLHLTYAQMAENAIADGEPGPSSLGNRLMAGAKNSCLKSMKGVQQ
jgi:hypothetical protein